MSSDNCYIEENSEELDDIETTEVPHYFGHRQRLKARFMKKPSLIEDYELLELILYWGIKRADVKPLAKQLLNEFGGIGNVIHAETDRLKTLGVSEANIVNTTVIREIIARITKEKVANKHIISSWNALIDYLQSVMGYLRTEQFRILFLNKKNVLIADESQEVGTIDQTIVYPREVIKRALYHEASAIILVHNHPSGNTKPSKADIELTNIIVKACATIGVTIHDHVVIGKEEYFSFKSNMLL